MYNSELRKHISIHEKKLICAICNKIVTNIQIHMNTAHKQCVACLNYFIDKQQLTMHEPQCRIVQAKTIKDSLKNKATKENSLEIVLRILNRHFPNY